VKAIQNSFILVKQFIRIEQKSKKKH
jgi:hypothetical protein